jgi:hypothetical protein
MMRFEDLEVWIKEATEISSMLSSLMRTKRGFIEKDS